MPLFKCTRCATQYHGAYCPKCGGKGELVPEASAASIGCLGILIIFFAFWVFRGLSGHPSGDSTNQNQGPTLTQEQRQTIRNLESTGMLRLDRQQQKAYVSILVWNHFDAKGKEDMAAFLAMECAIARGNKYCSVEIFDLQSARKLADYGPFKGFVAY